MDEVPIRTEPSLFRTDINASLWKIQDALNNKSKIFIRGDEKKDDKCFFPPSNPRFLIPGIVYPMNLIYKFDGAVKRLIKKSFLATL